MGKRQSKPTSNNKNLPTKQKSIGPKKQIGRPTNYEPKFCEMLVTHMNGGYSFSSFAAKIGVGRRILYDWCRCYPEFLEAYEAGYSAALLHYETQLNNGI